MPSLDSDEVAKALLDKMAARTENKSHRFFYLYDDDGTRVAQTWISHGTRGAWCFGQVGSRAWCGRRLSFYWRFGWRFAAFQCLRDCVGDSNPYAKD